MNAGDPRDSTHVMGSPPASSVILDDRPYLYFAGTGYLGLQADAEVARAASTACARWGVHAATSRSGFGDAPPVLEVERRASVFMGTESSLYLVSGYAVSFACCAALSGWFELVLFDECAHDCLREAAGAMPGLAHAPLAFRHRDAEDLERQLSRAMRPGWRALVVTDGVFAVSGRLAPVQAYLSVLGRYAGSALYLDDAHGMAVFGARGRGSLEWADLDPARVNRADERTVEPCVFHTATLSKAVGGHGGILVGASAFLSRVRTSSGWFRGASAPANPVAAATAKALEIVERRPELRAQLAANVGLLREGLRGLGLSVETSPAAIVGLALDSAETMRAVQRRLMDEGIAIAYVRDYAGAGPLGMLRIAVFATHTRAMIARLVEALGRAL